MTTPNVPDPGEYQVPSGFDPLDLLNRDLQDAARTLGDLEVRYMVDAYYQWQDNRKISGNVVRSSGDEPEPNRLMGWLDDGNKRFEKNILKALDEYSNAKIPGAWAKSIFGIGPVIAAGLLAHITIEECPTVGHIWRYAGLDPTSSWLGKEKAEKLVSAVVSGGPSTQVTAEQLVEVANLSGRKLDRLHTQTLNIPKVPVKNITKGNLAKAVAKRPYNARLKVLCWKIGESFVKVCNNPKDIYGKVYTARKAYETAKNDALDYQDQAASKLARFNIGHDTDAYKYYSSGQLPPAQIHARAQRYATKLFLSHYHHVAYETHFGTPPPKPYILNQPDHTHFLAPPGWPMFDAKEEAA